MLVLPPFKTMRPEVLKAIERLVADGAVVLGDAPQRSPSLQNYPNADKELTALAEKMWGKESKHPYGKGAVLSGMTIKEALAAINIPPDVKAEGNLAYAHRTAGDREIYFIANQSDDAISVSPEFRVAGRQPELWNPAGGEIRTLPDYELKDASTIVPLRLEPHESVFIVFAGEGNPKASGLKDNFPAPETIVEVSAPWTVTFDAGNIKRSPSGPVIFDKPESWSLNKDENVRYFSGTAVYNNTFTIKSKPAAEIYIDLGKVGVMAKVKINGKYAGGVWTYPYRVNITGQVKTGVNSIEIEVVNTWNNRFVGESSLPEDQRIVRPRNNKWNPSSPLEESGLLTPVKITAINSKH
jgi:hypothetical protein